MTLLLPSDRNQTYSRNDGPLFVGLPAFSAASTKHTQQYTVHTSAKLEQESHTPYNTSSQPKAPPPKSTAFPSSTPTQRQTAIAGATAGLVSRFVIAPLDVLKIRLQLQTTPLHRPSHAHVAGSSNGSVMGASNSKPAGTSRTPWAGNVRALVNQIWRDEGVRGFWKGNIPAEALYVCYGAVQFPTYRLTLHLLQSQTPQATGFVALGEAAGSSNKASARGGGGRGRSKPLNGLLAGAVAGGVATTATYPLDLLRTRFAAQGAGAQRVYRNLRSGVADIFAQEGALGFFRGLTAGLGSIVPYMALFFCGYEAVHPLLAHTASTHQGLLPFGSAHALAGVTAGVVARTGVFPLDLIRKRLQVQGPRRARYAGGTIPVYGKGVWRTGRAIVQSETWRGLYRGLGVGLLKSAPASAVTMWTYEGCLALLRQQHIQASDDA